MSGKDNVDAIPGKPKRRGGGGDNIARLAGYVVLYTLELAKISAVSRKLVRSGESGAKYTVQMWTTLEYKTHNDAVVPLCINH